MRLAALTTVPAKLLGVDKMLGTLERGKVASFIVTDGDLFARPTRIEQVWVDGARYDLKVGKKKKTADDVIGPWLLRVGTGNVERYGRDAVDELCRRRPDLDLSHVAELLAAREPATNNQ